VELSKKKRFNDSLINKTKGLRTPSDGSLSHRSFQKESQKFLMMKSGLLKVNINSEDEQVMSEVTEFRLNTESA
tara:strand:- start:1085 stop:1306 length:222 start_codon:yes stop_codon:yes gene_type:complete